MPRHASPSDSMFYSSVQFYFGDLALQKDRGVYIGYIYTTILFDSKNNVAVKKDPGRIGRRLQPVQCFKRFIYLLSLRPAVLCRMTSLIFLTKM